MLAFDTPSRTTTAPQSTTANLSPRLTRSGACTSCGANEASGHQFSCQPGRRITQGHMRRARRDARTSALFLENARIQDEMIGGL